MQRGGLDKILSQNCSFPCVSCRSMPTQYRFEVNDGDSDVHVGTCGEFFPWCVPSINLAPTRKGVSASWLAKANSAFKAIRAQDTGTKGARRISSPEKDSSPKYPSASHTTFYTHSMLRALDVSPPYLNLAGGSCQLSKKPLIISCWSLSPRIRRVVPRN